MKRTLPLITGIALLLTCGLVRGLWTDRWGSAAAPAAAAAKLEHLAWVIGEWEGRPIELEQAQRDASRVSGCIVRRYVHRVNGDAVTIFLGCGRPGPVSVHTPDVCYAGAGYKLAAPPTK